jgi:hypothetical protein
VEEHPKINFISQETQPMKTSKTLKIMEQLAAHRYYTHIANCQIKIPAVFRGKFGIFSSISKFYKCIPQFFVQHL